MPTAMLRPVNAFLDRYEGRWIIYLSLVLSGMYIIGQLSDPYIEHDDFDWLNFRFDQAYESPWMKTFSEGRWVNFPWSYLTQYLNVRGAFLLHLAVYSSLIWMMPRLLIGRSSVVSALLLFSAPMAAEASMWPVTQVTGAFVSLIACWGILAARCERDRLTWMAGGVFVGYMCYPSFGPVIMLLAATRTTGLHPFLRLAGFYILSFVGAVLFVFLLNSVFHGAFSIQPAGWRAATPLLHGGTLVGNMERYLGYYRQLATLWPALIVSALAYGVCFWRRIRCVECGAILVLGVMLLAMDGALSVVSGLDLPLRASLWLWMLLCFPVIFLIGEVRYRPVGLVLALPMLAFGALAWSNIYRGVRDVFPAVRALAYDVALAQAGADGSFDSMVVYGDVHDSYFLRRLHNNRALRNLLFKEYGWYSRPCSPALCDRVEAELARQSRLPRWIVVDRTFVIVLSRRRGDLY